VVLGGGGAVGIAWEAGVAGGLKLAGIDLREADLFVGTSAGSVVSTLLATGTDPLEHLMALAANPSATQGATPAVDMQSWMKVLARWSAVKELTQEVRREIGQMALESVTAPEENYVAVFAHMLQGLDWPERPLMITAVDVNTGEFKVWDRESGEPCPVCGKRPCECPKEPCPKCGQRPCVCKRKAKVKLADGKERTIQHMAVTSFWHPDGTPMTAQQFMELLFGKLPEFFKDEEELRTLWSAPDTRRKLLDGLADKGFGKSQLAEMQKIIDAENSDIFDVLAYVAYAMSPVTRKERAASAKAHISA
jgi:hypothetical protein